MFGHIICNSRDNIGLYYCICNNTNQGIGHMGRCNGFNVAFRHCIFSNNGRVFSGYIFFIISRANPDNNSFIISISTS